MKAARIFLVLVLTALFSVSSFSQAGGTQTSRLAGVVLDVNDARVAGAAVRIANAEFNRRVKSDDEGNFEISVPPGTYEITVEQPGFRKFQLSRFRVGGGTCELVNIHLEVQPPKSPLKVDTDQN